MFRLKILFVDIDVFKVSNSMIVLIELYWFDCVNIK